MGKVIKAEDDEIFDIELSQNLLEANEKIAIQNSKIFEQKNIKTIEIMGSIGSGKTSLIECIVQKLRSKYKIASVAGDLTTTIDSDRIKRHGVDVVQINTGRECHLDANLVNKALKKIDLNLINLLIIENVGNLICPAEFHLGSNKRLVVISVTEGPYMVVKHPMIFIEADVVVINKTDLSSAMGVDINLLEKDVKKINQSSKVIRTNCRNCTGIEDVINALGL